MSEREQKNSSATPVQAEQNPKERRPYKFLDYYSFEDADLFFGREKEVQRMVSEILNTRLLVLFSPSGSGKTSLINAGVRPALEKMGYQTVYTRMEHGPEKSVQIAVAEALELKNEESKNVGDTKESATVPANSLYEFLQRVTKDAKKPLVIFIDQFEEFFIIWREQRALRNWFVTELKKINYDYGLPVFLVLSLREDYFVDLHEFREAIPPIFQNNANIHLEPFTDDEAQRAIIEPAKALGCKYENGLVQRLLTDLKIGAEGIEPIKLQIVCDTLWNARRAPTVSDEKYLITQQAYQANGGAKQILAKKFSHMIADFGWRSKRLLIRVFEALKTPDNTKRTRTFEDLWETLRTNQDRLKTVLHKLTLANLLRREIRGGTEWYEFKHDYLVQEVTDWIQAMKERRMKRRLWIGLAPAALIILGLIGFVIYDYNQFYVTLSDIEYKGHRQQMVINRSPRIFKQRVFTLDFYKPADGLGDLRDHTALNELSPYCLLSGGEQEDWLPIARLLRLDRAGLFLYQLGQKEAGLDTLVHALANDDNDVKSDAMSALENLGREDDSVLAALVHELENEKWSISASAADILGNTRRANDSVVVALVQALSNKDWHIASAAAGALGNLGRADSVIVMALLNALGNQELRINSAAASALGNLAQKKHFVVPMLLKALLDENSSMRAGAADALGYLDQADESAVVALRRATYDVNIDVRYYAIESLGNLNRSDVAIVTTVVQAFGDKEWRVRAVSAKTLGNLNRTDSFVIEALLRALGDKSSHVRLSAADALGNLNRTDNKVVAALIRGLKDESSGVRSGAANALEKLGRAHYAVAPALMKAINEEYFIVRAGAVSILEKVGREEEWVLMIQLWALGNEYNRARTAIAAALGLLEQVDDAVVMTLLRTFSEEYKIKSIATRAIGNLGRAFNLSAERLEDLDNQEWNVRYAANSALQRLGRSKQPLVSQLTRVLGHEDHGMRSAAANALGILGQGNDSVKAALLPSINDKNSEVKSASISALGKLCQKDRALVTSLIRALNDKEHDVRSAAASALRTIGWADDSVMVVLLKTLDDENWEPRFEAIKTIKELGRIDEGVIAAFIRALGDADSDVRTAAASALGKIYQHHSADSLFNLLENHLSGYRTAGIEALARQDSFRQLLPRINQMKDSDTRPWVKLGAWHTYELIQQRIRAEAEARKTLHKADSLFTAVNYQQAEWQYGEAFNQLINIIVFDSLQAGQTKFKQARCNMQLNRKLEALEDLETAITYHDTFRDSLRQEIAVPNGTFWALRQNWYMQKILLKEKHKNANK